MGTRKRKQINRNRRGAALIMSMIFVFIFSALAVSMATLSSGNVQLSNNQHKVNSAIACSHSGLEILRYYFSGITVSSSVAPENRLSSVAASFQNALTEIGVTNISASYDSSSDTLNIASVTLNSEQNETFSATISYGDDYDTVVLDVTGSNAKFSRVVRTNFTFVDTASGVFDYGVATRGPLEMSGQAEILGGGCADDGSVYIEADGISNDAFSITNNSSVAGDVSIADEFGTYSAGNQSVVGGATGDDIADHVHVDVDTVDFPTPDAEYFRSFATGGVISDSHDWSSDSVLSNMIVSANTNPTFSGCVIINGILFIDSPNVVHFAGQSTVNGLIIASGDLNDNSGTNNISFSGQIQCNDMTELTGSEFDAIKQQTGTFILAPGFNLSFSGQAMNMNGAIAANGISFSGQATGTVNGSIINYSTEPMTMGGQASMTFNRSGPEVVPSGFSSDRKLAFVPASYSELH